MSPKSAVDMFTVRHHSGRGHRRHGGGGTKKKKKVATSPIWQFFGFRPNETGQQQKFCARSAHVCLRKRRADDLHLHDHLRAPRSS